MMSSASRRKMSPERSERSFSRNRDGSHNQRSARKRSILKSARSDKQDPSPMRSSKGNYQPQKQKMKNTVSGYGGGSIKGGTVSFADVIGSGHTRQELNGDLNDMMPMTQTNYRGPHQHGRDPA